MKVCGRRGRPSASHVPVQGPAPSSASACTVLFLPSVRTRRTWSRRANQIPAFALCGAESSCRVLQERTFRCYLDRERRVVGWVSGVKFVAMGWTGKRPQEDRDFSSFSFASFDASSAPKSPNSASLDVSSALRSSSSPIFFSFFPKKLNIVWIELWGWVEKGSREKVKNVCKSAHHCATTPTSFCGYP